MKPANLKHKSINLVLAAALLLLVLAYSVIMRDYFPEYSSLEIRKRQLFLAPAFGVGMGISILLWLNIGGSLSETKYKQVPLLIVLLVVVQASVMILSDFIIRQ